MRCDIEKMEGVGVIEIEFNVSHEDIPIAVSSGIDSAQ